MAWFGVSGAGQRKDRSIATTLPRGIAISARNLTTWIRCVIGAGLATSSGMGTVLTQRFRCRGESWKSGSNGFRAETQWRYLHSVWSPLLTISSGAWIVLSTIQHKFF